MAVSFFYYQNNNYKEAEILVFNWKQKQGANFFYKTRRQTLLGSYVG